MYWEVWIVLNGEKEPYYSAIESYIHSQQIADNFHLLYTSTAGVSNARNMGLDAAQGEYISFVDDDDYVSDCYLERLYHVATPQTVAASYIQTLTEEQNNYLLKAQKHYIPGLEYDYRDVRKIFSIVYQKLIHRDIIGDRRFDTQLSNGEDSLFAFAISDRLQNVRFTSDDAIYYKRFRQDSASHRPNRSAIIRYCTTLIIKYTQIYLSGHYSLKFYITRLLGAVHTMIE